MKKFNALLLILLLSVGCSQENASDKYALSITSEELSDLIYEFSSDKFEGRGLYKTFEIHTLHFMIQLDVLPYNFINIKYESCRILAPKYRSAFT